jgi:hypothetical protein
MKRKPAGEPRILHATPGRLRVQLSAGSCPQGPLEEGLRQLPGVTRARLNSLTGNVLIHFDPQCLSQDALLAAVAALEGEWANYVVEQPLPGSAPDSAGRAEGPVLAAWLIKVAGLLGARKSSASVTGAAAVVAAVPLLQDSPLVNRKLGHLLGVPRRDVLLSLASILANLLTANPLRIALASVEALLLLCSLCRFGNESIASSPPIVRVRPQAA